MIGERLGVDLHVVTSEAAAARNLMLAVERCHLGIEAVIATPYAAGSAALVDDEAEMGCAGRRHGRRHHERRHLLQRAPGPFRCHRRRRPSRDDGHRARPHDPRVRRRAAQDPLRLSRIVSSADDRDMIAVPQVDEDERDVPNPSAEVAPRAHHQAAGRGDPRTRARSAERRGLRGPGRTAGRAHGRREPARRPAGNGAPHPAGQVRVGRPLGIKGLPEAAKGPAFSAVVGHAGLSAGRAYRVFRAAFQRLVPGVREPTATSRGWAAGSATVSRT